MSEKIYEDNVRNYYNRSFCTLYPDKYVISEHNNSFPDGKTQRRERRARAIRRRKGRL